MRDLATKHDFIASNRQTTKIIDYEKSNCSLTIYVDYMQANSLSRSDIANKLGVTPQYVSRILSGNTNFSFKSVAEIERKLGISCMETAMT